MKHVLSLSVLGLAVLLSSAAFAESAGEKVFKQKCAMCHKVNDKGGAIGPDLTKISGKLTETQLREKLINPKRAIPAPPCQLLQRFPRTT